MLINNLENLDRETFYLIITNKKTNIKGNYYYLNINDKILKNIFNNDKIFIIIDCNIFADVEKTLTYYNYLLKKIDNETLPKIKNKKIYTKYKNNQLLKVYKVIKKIYNLGNKNNVDFKYKHFLLGYINYHNIPWSMLNELSYLNKIITLKNEKEKYTYIYDKACDLLDIDYKLHNQCEFENSKCINMRLLNKKENNTYGCCFIGGKVCKHFKNNCCSTKSLSCKLFVCRHLKKEGKNLTIDDILILKLFFNYRQKDILNMNVSQTKEETINKLLNKKH